MDIQLDIWLRGDNHATTAVIAPVPNGPEAWTDADVVAVLEAMLRALERAKHPETTPDRAVALRGFSWIVSPFEAGGVVIALELTLGAVVAGPFTVPESELSRRIERVMGAQKASSTTVH